MAVESGDGIHKAPTVEPSAPQVESSPPTLETHTLTLVNVQPSAAPQEEAATVDVPEDAIGGGSDDPALSTDGGSQAEHSPSPETPTSLTVSLSQPSEAPQVQVDSRPALPPTVDAPENVIGSGRDDPALGTDGGTQTQSGSGTVISGFVAAPQPQPQLQRAARFDQARYFRPVGAMIYPAHWATLGGPSSAADAAGSESDTRIQGLVAGLAALQTEQQLAVRDAQDMPARATLVSRGFIFQPEPVEFEAEPEPPMDPRARRKPTTDLGGYCIEILRGPSRSLPAPRHPDALAIVPWILPVDTPPIDLLPEPARTTVMLPEFLREAREMQSPLGLEVIEPAPHHDIGGIGDRMLAAHGPGAPEMARMVPTWIERLQAALEREPRGQLLEPARTRTRRPPPPTGPELLQQALERMGLLPSHQHQHAQSSLIEPERPQSEQLSSAAGFVALPRADVQHGWDLLQARDQECRELRQRSQHLARQLALQGFHTQEELQQDYEDLRQRMYFLARERDLQEHHIQALQQELRQALHQTPRRSRGSSSSSRVAGERRPGVCGDCFRPAEMVLVPCLHMALCHICYEKCLVCPCCGDPFAFPGFE